MLTSETRKHIATLLNKLRPLFWIWLLGAIALLFCRQELGLILLGAYGLFWCILTALDKPDHCPKGHTDIGFYYGRWSCRACYRLEQQKWGRRAKRRLKK